VLGPKLLCAWLVGSSPVVCCSRAPEQRAPGGRIGWGIAMSRAQEGQPEEEGETAEAHFKIDPTHPTHTLQRCPLIPRGAGHFLPTGDPPEPSGRHTWVRDVRGRRCRNLSGEDLILFHASTVGPFFPARVYMDRGLRGAWGSCGGPLGSTRRCKGRACAAPLRP